MFLILEGFSENGQGKVEPCMLNLLLQKQNQGMRKTRGEVENKDGGSRTHVPCPAEAAPAAGSMARAAQPRGWRS